MQLQTVFGCALLALSAVHVDATVDVLLAAKAKLMEDAMNAACSALDQTANSLAAASAAKYGAMDAAMACMNDALSKTAALKAQMMGFGINMTTDAFNAALAKFHAAEAAKLDAINAMMSAANNAVSSVKAVKATILSSILTSLNGKMAAVSSAVNSAVSSFSGAISGFKFSSCS